MLLKVTYSYNKNKPIFTLEGFDSENKEFSRTLNIEEAEELISELTKAFNKAMVDLHTV